MRLVRKAAARLDELADAMAVGSTRQPSGPPIRVPHSTNPRSIADAMKGLPSASRSTNSAASSGKRPAIDSISCRTSAGASGASRRWAEGLSCRKGWSSGTSSVRNAATRTTCRATSEAVSSIAACQRRISRQVDSPAHWQSSSMSKAGRRGVPRASRKAANDWMVRVSPVASGPSDRESPPFSTAPSLGRAAITESP